MHSSRLTFSSRKVHVYTVTGKKAFALCGIHWPFYHKDFGSVELEDLIAGSDKEPDCKSCVRAVKATVKEMIIAQNKTIKNAEVRLNTLAEFGVKLQSKNRIEALLEEN